jgi:hypothetical protein
MEEKIKEILKLKEGLQLNLDDSNRKLTAKSKLIGNMLLAERKREDQREKLKAFLFWKGRSNQDSKSTLKLARAYHQNRLKRSVLKAWKGLQKESIQQSLERKYNAKYEYQIATINKNESDQVNKVHYTN